MRCSLLPAAMLAAAALFAQSPAEPAFDVVSIRPVPANAPPTHRSQDFTPVLPGGRYTDERTNIQSMIALAYGIRFPAKQILDLPPWTRHKDYSVTAKASPDLPVLPEAQNLAQVRQMLRKMLAERFRLRIHAETRVEPVFLLKPAKGGVKIREVPPPVPPAKPGFVNATMSDASGRMIGHKATMEGMATALSIFLPRRVVDNTGLSGHYDVDIRWQTNEPRNPDAPGGFGSDGVSLLISNLKEQLGLQLETGKGPVEYWRVEHIEPPTEN